MKRITPKSPVVYISLAALWLILLFALPRSAQFSYDYRKGFPWNYDELVAQFDFPLLKTEEEMQAERADAGMVPYYQYMEDPVREALIGAESLQLDAQFRAGVSSVLSVVYSKGVVAEIPQAEVIFIQRGKRASKEPSASVFTPASARARLFSEMSEAGTGINLDSLLNASGAYALIVPNLVYDGETSALMHARGADYISPTSGFVSAGEKIVSRGEIVTSDIARMIDSYKAEYEQSLGYGGPRVLIWLANGIFALAFVVILFLSVLYTNPLVFRDTRRFVYLATIVACTSVMALAVDQFNPRLLYLAPFSLMTLFLLAFFRKGVVLPAYMVALLPLLVFTHEGIELFVIFLLGGIVSIYTFEFYSKGWRQFVNAFIIFLVMLLPYLAFRMLNDESLLTGFDRMILLFASSLLSVIGYPFVYLLEKLFGLVSTSRLNDLSDTSGKLLTELSQKAPGTFQHSLQVMNMAETAGRSIDANIELLRAGALYHDIGKMANPQCFIENETFGEHYHEGLTPKESAREILQHIPDGVALAAKYHLPGVLVDFIRTHHGKSVTAFFYNKYVNSGGDPADTADFTYGGELPQTREQCILMLCDSIEAASRTLKDHKPETFDAFVENMFESKIKDGQLSASELSLAELQTVKAALKSYLAQLYHDRISYPKRRK